MIKIKKNINLKTFLQQHDLSFPCNGNGTCGNCKIKVIKGYLPINSYDKKFFTQDELNEGYRLACQHTTTEDIDIELIHSSKEAEIEGITQDDIKKTSYKMVTIRSNEIEASSVLDQMMNESGKKVKITSKLLRETSQLIKENKELNLIVFDDEIIHVTNANTTYGIAIDIGTTTVVISLIDVLTGELIDVFKTLNAQKKYGADVISRILHANLNGVESLKAEIIQDIEKGIHHLIMNHHIHSKDIIKMIISGNNAMTHFLLGLSVKTLGEKPYKPLYTETLTLHTKEIFEKLSIECEIDIIANFSGFVGGDIVSGLLTTDIDKSDDIYLFIDLGTNGEIVIGNKNRLLASSMATGPAFEGGNISCGVGSINGAIDRITYQEGKFLCHTIGHKKPIGICGSGLIDLIRELKQNQMIDLTGKMKSNTKEIIVYDKLSITQKDIREFQLAKSAIRSGIEILIDEYHCSVDDIKTVYLSGGFGSHLNIQNVIEIGILPKALASKIVISGNTSLKGAVDYLLNKIDNRVNRLQNNVRTINLADNIRFNDQFVNNIMFE